MRRRYGDGELAILPLVYPLDASCNPQATQTMKAGHEDACGYARLSLAVWRAKPAAFDAFHDAVMSPDDLKQTLPLREARMIAETLLGREALEVALTNPGVDHQLALNIAAKGKTGKEFTEYGEYLDYRPCTMWGGQRDKPGQVFLGRLARYDDRTTSLFEESTGAKPLVTEREDDVMRSLSRRGAQASTP
jgi:hypothetical protein